MACARARARIAFVEFLAVRAQQPAGGQPAPDDDVAALRRHGVDAPGLGVEPVGHQHLARPGGAPGQALRLDSHSLTGVMHSFDSFDGRR